MGTADPLAVILERPYRRSHSENILRELMYTSYPHALLGNLAVAVAVQAQYTPEQLQGVAKDFRRAEESAYGVLDFIRCVEFKRKLGVVDLVVKTLKIDLPLIALSDDRKNHELLATGSVQLPDAQFSLPDPEALAKLLIQSYYTARSPRETTALEHSSWICRTRTTLTGANNFAHSDEILTTDQATAMLVTSLKRNKFHFIMTPNTLLVMDQKKRLWGLNKRPIN